MPQREGETPRHRQVGARTRPAPTPPPPPHAFSAPRSKRCATLSGGGWGGQELSVIVNFDQSRPAAWAAASSSGMYSAGRVDDLQGGEQRGGGQGGEGRGGERGKAGR